MKMIEYLREEWVPTVGCTEPASIALAGTTAAGQLKNPVTGVKLIVDPKMYKNCYAVGIPFSGHKTGIKWATAIGCFLKDRLLKLECFRGIGKDVLEQASSLIESNRVAIRIDRTKGNLFIDLEAGDNADTARCVIEGTHTNIVLVARNGKPVLKGKDKDKPNRQNLARKWAASLETADMLKNARAMGKEERENIRGGSHQNIKIALHGLTLFPRQFVAMTETDSLTRIAGLVCAGVYARMWGEDFPVMSVAGSGNKGIVSTVPLVSLQKEWNIDQKKLEEALALAMLFTSKTTEELGTLSAVCGCSNAAGIGLASALTYLRGGGEKEISYTISNMVGNVTGMICDGAKIGCALKTMTAVDAAFRASALAINGIGIPFQDGIVGRTGSESLINMGKIAKDGMIKTDDEILKIMEAKLNQEGSAISFRNTRSRIDRPW